MEDVIIKERIIIDSKKEQFRWGLINKHKDGSWELWCALWDMVSRWKDNEPKYHVLISGHKTIEDAIERAEEVAKEYPYNHDITLTVNENYYKSPIFSYN